MGASSLHSDYPTLASLAASAPGASSSQGGTSGSTSESLEQRSLVVLFGADAIAQHQLFFTFAQASEARAWADELFRLAYDVRHGARQPDPPCERLLLKLYQSLVVRHTLTHSSVSALRQIVLKFKFLSLIILVVCGDLR